MAIDIKTGKKWLDERLEVLIPALSPLTTEQEERIAQLCNDEMEYWRSRMNKESALRPVVSAARKVITQRIKLTPANRWMNELQGEYQHLALKYINLDWDELNAVDEEKVRERMKHQQLIENPRAVIAKAEKLLQSNRWEDILIALAIVTGCRETELLKTIRFFFKSLYTVEVDGQLKRRDLAVKPYEKPVLLPAESVVNAWRKLRGLVDCSDLEINEVSAKYSKVLAERANYQFAGLIPQKHQKENLYTQAFRAVYARIAVHWFCPKTVDDLIYLAAILGHHQADTDSKRLSFAATIHYVDYAIDDVKGVRLEEPGVKVLDAFQFSKGDASMTTDTTTQDEAQDTQEQQPVLQTKKPKNRGTFTTKPGTYDAGIKIMEDRGLEGTGGHDRLLVDLMHHDAIAHQMYELLQPLAPELAQDEHSPLATLQALITAYRAGGGGPQAQELAALLEEIDDEKPVVYLRKLVDQDVKFQTAIANRHSKVDYKTASMEDLRHKYKTPDAATERFRRAFDAIIQHNDAAPDKLHMWYINAAAIRRLVGGQNKLIQDYIRTREAEQKAHHEKYGLTAKQNEKDADIAAEITIK